MSYVVLQRGAFSLQRLESRRRQCIQQILHTYLLVLGEGATSATHPEPWMLLRRIGFTAASFVFHGGAAKRSFTGFSNSPVMSTKVVGGIAELCDRYDGFILDQFGVLHGEYLARTLHSARCVFAVCFYCS